MKRSMKSLSIFLCFLMLFNPILFEAAAWAEKFLHRTVEELYDIKHDPVCKKNLINAPEYEKKLVDLQEKMESEMIKAGDDKFLAAFKNRGDKKALATFMNEYNSSKGKLSSDPKRTREIFFNPHDDWVLLDYTILEPKGTWGIWRPDGEGIYIRKSQEKFPVKYFGANEIAFDASMNTTPLLITDRRFEVKTFSKIRINVAVLKEKAPLTSTMSFVYNDGSGWKEFKTFSGKKIYGNKTIEFTPPKNLKAEVQFGIQCDFKGAKTGRIFVDSLRITALQKWTKELYETFDRGLGSLKDVSNSKYIKSSPINKNGAVEMIGKSSSVALSSSLAADKLSVIRV